MLSKSLDPMPKRRAFLNMSSLQCLGPFCPQKSLFSKECSFKPASQLKNRKDRTLCTFGAFQWNDSNRSSNMRTPSQAHIRTASAILLIDSDQRETLSKGSTLFQ